MSDPISDIIHVFKDLIKTSNSAAHTQTVLSKIRNIFTSEATARVFAYFCLHGASTAWVLQCELNMPEATVYRTIKRLRAIGVLAPALKIRKVKHSRGGPRPTVWVVDTASPDEVAAALRLHYQMIALKEEKK